MTTRTTDTLSASKAVSQFTDLYHRENELYHAAARKAGVSESALNILYDLFEQDGITQKQICLGNGLSKQTVNSSLKRLAADGYVTVETCGRTTRLWLTDSGRALAQERVEPIMAAERRAMESFSANERTELLALYTRYVEAFAGEVATLDFR